MPTLLYLKGSPRELSHSDAVAGAMLAALLADGWEIDRLDVWRADLPALDGAAIAAKYAVLAGEPHDKDQAAAWRTIAALVGRLDRADRVLISTPMWNFGIPYKLKHWLDLVTQPGLSFAFDPQTGYRPLLQDRPVTIVLASAGDYSHGPSWGQPDLASEYLQAALAFIGLTSVEIVRAGPTVGDNEVVQAAQDRAKTRLAAIARGAAA